METFSPDMQYRRLFNIFYNIMPIDLRLTADMRNAKNNARDKRALSNNKI